MKTVAHVATFNPQHRDVVERFEEFKHAHRDVTSDPPIIFSPLFVKLEAQPWGIKGKNPNLKKGVLGLVRRQSWRDLWLEELKDKEDDRDKGLKIYIITRVSFFLLGFHIFGCSSISSGCFSFIF